MNCYKAIQYYLANLKIHNSTLRQKSTGNSYTCTQRNMNRYSNNKIAFNGKKQKSDFNMKTENTLNIHQQEAG